MRRIARAAFGFLAPLSLAACLAAQAAAAIDLTGKWRVEYEDASTEFIDVTDVAGAVSLTLNFIPGSPGVPVLLTGTFSEPLLSLSLSAPGCLPPDFQEIEASALPGGDDFDGWYRHYEGSIPMDVHRVLAHRCECFDGNTVEGDGCDAACRVEPCFTCTGMPSSCSPTSDGGSCSDGSPCTMGETCNGGVCSGSPAAPCVDLSGLWDVTREFGLSTHDYVRRIEQHDTVVLFRDDATGRPQFFGTIAPATGAFTLGLPQLGYMWCFGTDPMYGTAALDGQTFEANGTLGTEGVHACLDPPFMETGTRRCPGSPGCAAAVPTVTPVGGIALGALITLATAWTLRRRRAPARGE